MTTTVFTWHLLFFTKSFDVKRDEFGNAHRKKARFVVCGYSQVPGVDYFERYSPVTDPAVFRLSMEIGMRFALTQRVFDFKCAFLNGVLSEELLIKQPKGFEVGDAMKKVLKLTKSIYELKQASLEWRRALVAELAKLDLHPIKTNLATYVRQCDGVILNSHVDDINAIVEAAALDVIGERLRTVFELRNLGEAKFIVGVRVEFDRKIGAVYWSQEAYIDKVLNRFTLMDVNPAPTPMVEGLRLTKKGAI